jgi:hypothetical protein
MEITAFAGVGAKIDEHLVWWLLLKGTLQSDIFAMHYGKHLVYE